MPDYGSSSTIGSSVETAEITDDAVTFPKIQNITTDRLLGRDTAASGDVEEISVDTSLEWTGTGAIRRAALTGDVTASAGSNATTIANDAVSYAKIQNMTTSRILGRTTASSGDIEELTAGSNLSLAAGSLNVATTLTGLTLTTPTLTTPTTNGEKLAQVAKTANYTMTSTDYVVRCDASGGAFTITLPTAASIAGTIYKIIRTDITSSSTLLTVDGNAAETIDGMANWKLHQGEFLVVMSDGTNWVSIAHPSPSLYNYYFLKNSTNDRRYHAINNMVSGVSTSTTSPAANTLWAVPFIVSKVTKFDTISFYITTAQAAQNANAGIYYDNGNCYPGALIFNTGSVSTATTGTKDTTITAALQIFQPGLYWLAWETSATTIQIRMPTSSATAQPALLGIDSAIADTNSGLGYSVADTYGATLPDPYPASATILTTNSVSAPVPLLSLRAV